MIFRPDLTQRVLCGRKTVTRRLVSDKPHSLWALDRGPVVGRRYSINPGRGKPAVGRIVVRRAYVVPWLNWISDDEARCEGFDSAEAFLATWDEIHNGPVRSGRFIWVVEFELASGLALARPARAIGWELRSAWATGRRVALSIDGDVTRVEGIVLTVAATDAFTIVDGGGGRLHVPLDRILAVHRPSRLGDSEVRPGETWSGPVPAAARRDPRQVEMDLDA